MNPIENQNNPGVFRSHSATLKILFIGFLFILLLIPSALVFSLISERESRKESVIQEISQKWGNSQDITGPFITLPYKSFYKDEEDRLKFNIHYLHILPEELNISGEIEPHIRSRGIYDAVLYNSKITANGIFVLPGLSEADISPEDVLWDKAALCIGITDMRGIKDNIVVRFNDQDYKVVPGLKTADLVTSGVQTGIALSPDIRKNSFSFQLNLNGSDQLHFVPLGETTNLALKSSWPSPGFNGSFLPANRKISQDGFTADWQILQLNRNYPQFWSGRQYGVGGSSFGLELTITADLYQKTTRMSKYAVMFILFTFAALFLSEIINKQQVHPIQYLLIGLAIILFYVLLLSFSEHLNFDIAYLLSATAITLTITGYLWGFLRSNQFTLTVFGILILLYSYLYIILQLEDYALLMGAVGLFFVLATVMYITRKIDWYTIGAVKKTDQ